MQAERISRRYDVKALHIVLVTIVAAVTLTSVAAAGPDAARQRVAITMRNLPNGKFVLEPLQAGALERTRGVSQARNAVIREGRQLTTISTFTEGSGDLMIREQIVVYAGGPSSAWAPGRSGADGRVRPDLGVGGLPVRQSREGVDTKRLHPSPVC
jgi:hypothetical protein